MEPLSSAESVVNARELAAALLAGTGDRWAHVEGVARRANELRGVVDAPDRDVLVEAAWLHDVGYSSEASDTGLHSLDGARFLLSRSVGRRICGLVAFHSGAVYEAEERGLLRELSEFTEEHSPVADALVAADFTTGPQGQRMTVNERIAEIRGRYGPDDPVHRAVTRSQDVLREQVARALARAGQPT